MQRMMRVGIVLAVVALAIVAALPFRKTSAPQVREAGPSRQNLERRISGAPTALPTYGAESLGSPPLRVPTAATGMPAESSADLPQMPPTYHRTFSPVGALLSPAEDREPADSARDQALAFDEPHTLDLDAADAEGRPLTHKIVDGDTLHELAGRYLGDAQRWREVYDLNRDVLSSPDLLPIGRVIKIPPRNNPSTDGASPETAPESALAPIPRGAFHAEP